MLAPGSRADHFKGSLDAPVTLIEYGDFQCSHCAAARGPIDDLLHEFSDQICFIYRHFPLRTIHPVAEFAAVASEAASLQGEFWPMHRMLFEAQDTLSRETIFGMAACLRLDVHKFELDVKSEALFEKVRRHFNGGIRSGVSSTPTMFINGERFDGGTASEIWRAKIVEILSET